MNREISESVFSVLLVEGQHNGNVLGTLESLRLAFLKKKKLVFNFDSFRLRVLENDAIFVGNSIRFSHTKDIFS